MAQWLSLIVLCLAFPVVLLSRSGPSAAQTVPGSAPEAKDMALVGFHDLQGRSAYQPIIQQQGGRFIAYIGHHGGSALNLLNGKTEPNGTSIVDVTDPQPPRYLHHVPGAARGTGEAGGAQMVRACAGKDLPKGDPAKTYLLRTVGNQAHEVLDVTDPSTPTLVSTVVAGLTSTHKNWWECDTGIAYIVAHKKAEGWRSRGVKIFDLSDPAHPRYIRDYGVVGQEPGSSGEPVPAPLHGPIRLGNRVYFGYGTSAGGILQIVDRAKLLKGDPTSPDPFALTAKDILYALKSADWIPRRTSEPIPPFPSWGYTSLSSPRTSMVKRPTSLSWSTRPFRMSAVSIGRWSSWWMSPPHQSHFLWRIFRFQRPVAISAHAVDASGAHASNESFTPIYYRRLVFISYFNAGVRAVDIRDPYRPQEVAFYIPAITEKTDRRCVPITGGGETCKVAIQTNNVEVDDRGYIYIVDRANTGMHILELTGAARAIANFP